ncbi:Rib/alpha-like domain-containing protein, partial [Streptococcus infantis]|uniref:Rib/alpha-like domain-containing protein n=1 Tax=Streptococcus infantis TaxID=68892 RepID=UPI0039C4BD3F
MYFNRKNAEQKNWRMIKKGKHFLFGCSLVFAVGAALVAPTVKADTADTGEVETKTANSAAEASSSDEVGTYKAPAVEVSTTSPVVAENPTSSEATSAKTANKEALTQLVEEVKGLDKAGKTEDSLSRLNTALEQAQNVLANAEASQDQVDVAVASLKDAVAQLAAKEEKAATVATEAKAEEATEAETSATQPKSRSRRAAGQERAQDRSAEGKDINFEYRSRKKIEDGDPTQRAKIEYRQLGDYEVADGKTVATDPEGKGRPVLEWTVTFNEAQYDLMGGYYYFTIPKNVSEPYKVVTEYNNGAYRPRDGWVDGNVTSGGSPSAEGQQFIDAGNKLNWRVGNTVGNINSVPGLSGVMDQTEKVYVLGFANNTKARKVTIKYRTVVTDPSQAISYIAGIDSKTGAPRNNWYGLTGKYDKHLVSQVDAPKVTPNLTNTSVNVPIQTVASTSSTLSGTGVPGAKIKLYIDGQEQNIGNVTVDSAGNWTTGELPTALNNNQGDGTTIKPRQTVEVSQVVNGEESSRRTVPVSVGVTTVEPSSLTTNQAAVVAGQKEVTLKVPHDAGIAYMRYTNTAGETVEIPVKRDNASSAWTSQKPEAATVKRVENGKFQDTIILTMADKIAGTEVSAISNVVDGGFSSVAGWEPRGVENQAPTIASAVEGNQKTVAQGAQLDLASLVTVADKEDDAQATLGDKVHAEVVSVNGNAATKTVDTNTPGTYTVKYKAVDSQGLESNEIEVTVVVNPARDNVAPTVEIPYSDPAPNKKEVYLYTGEDADVDITFNDDSGKIKSASLKKGGNIALNNVDGNPEKQDNEYGYTVTAINSETATPAKIKVTGRVSGLEDRLPKTENDSLELVTRYATATDTDGAEISNNATKTKKNGEVVGSYLTDPGAVTFVLKAQTKKYDIKTPSEVDKVAVSDANNVTDKEFEKIKEKVKVEYSQNNPDARLADKKGQEVEDASKVVDKVEKDGNNVVVTYKDGSKDTKPLTDFARTNVAPTVEIPYSDPAPNKKEVYLYTGEDADVDITFSDDSGKIKSASLKKGGNIALNNIDGNPDKQDNEYGYTVTAINSETATPAKIKVTGRVSGLEDRLPKTENDSLELVTRYATATDTDGAEISNNATKTKKNGEVVGSYLTDPGAVTFVLKAQTKKYDIKTPSEADKVTVSDANNVTDKEFEKIKEKVKVEYSQNNPDARLADKKGQEVEDASKVVDKVEKDGNNVVVTYKDGSKDTKPLSEFVNVAPKVEVPYSNEANKQIYVYTGENTDLTFKGTDEKEVKDLYLRGPGDVKENNANKYGFTTGKVENGAVTGEGSVSEDKTSATIKMTGTTNLKAGQEWTSFIVSKDNNGELSNTDYRALDVDPNAKEKPGYVRFVVKNQTSKYDIATPAPADKVEVADPTNVTKDELAKIKEKLKLEYNKDNDDANIAKNTPVDKDGKIESVTNDGKGNLVVTYKDGSTDTKPLSEFVTQKPSTPEEPTDADKNEPKAKDQTVKVGEEPKAEDSIENFKGLP